ncbi:MAG TPA: hypothetical protein DCS15_10340 [Flavobacteriales bacterium]|nr:hypothetical protein [Flavobacteriales bacterium]
MKSIQQHLKANWYYYLLGLLMYMPIFGHLNSLPLRYWDELRLAISAWEMLEHGQYLVPHYFGEPDLWNTKPPLMVWAQVFFMKTIGVNEMAVRLPSAISAFLTCVAILVFSKKYIKSRSFRNYSCACFNHLLRLHQRAWNTHGRLRCHALSVFWPWLAPDVFLF